MYKNIGGKGSGKKTTHSVCSIIMGVLIAISIILFIIGIVMFLQPPKKIAPLHNPKNPKSIMYSGKHVTCKNINLKRVVTNGNENNETLYTIDKSQANMLYPNAITLVSGVPSRGFYSCTANKKCLTYKFTTKSALGKNATEQEMGFTKDQNCIGGVGLVKSYIEPNYPPRYTYSHYINNN